MESPKQFTEIGASLVEAYGVETAIEQVENNIKYLQISLGVVCEHEPNLVGTRIKLALQIDFWRQVLQTIKN